MRKTAVLAIAWCVSLWGIVVASPAPKVNNIPDNPISLQQAQPDGSAESTAIQLPGEYNPNESTAAQLVDIPGLAKPKFSGPPNVPDPAVILQGGDTFESAILIRSLPYIDSGTTSGYTNDYEGNCGGTGAPDVVYLFQPMVDDVVTFGLCNSADYDSKLFICANGDPDNILACNDDACGPGNLQAMITYPVVTGTDYYIVVDGNYSDYGNYILEVTGSGPIPGVCGGDSAGFLNGFPDGVNAVTALRTRDGFYDRWVVDDIEITNDMAIREFHWYSVSSSGFDWSYLADFIILSDNNGTPGDTLTISNDVYAGRETTGNIFMGLPEYIYTIAGLSIQLQAGRYWLGLRPVSTSAPGNYWETAWPGFASGIYVSYPDLGRPTWTPGRDAWGMEYNVSFCVTGEMLAANVCDTSLYSNGPDRNYVWASQCDHSTPFVASTADDFVLSGDGEYEITAVAAYLGMFVGGDPGPNFTGIIVTFYANNTGGISDEPGGHPIDGDPNCTHVETMEGGIISSQILTPDRYTYGQSGNNGNYQFVLPLSPVRLHGGTTYWLEVEPIMDFATHYRCGVVPTTNVTGNYAKMYFPAAGYTEWSDNIQADIAFCLFGEPAGPACSYVAGDANGNGALNGLDVTYSVAYFKGGPPPPYECECTPGNTWYVAGDVNQSCGFNGLDVTYMVAYFKGGPLPHSCPDCPPAELLAPPVPGVGPIPAVRPIVVPNQKVKPKAGSVE